MEMYTSYTREDVMEVMGKYLTEERRIQVIALPLVKAEEQEQKTEQELPVGAAAD